MPFSKTLFNFLVKPLKQTVLATPFFLLLNSHICLADLPKKIIRVAAPADWCPYTCDQKLEGVEGFQIEIARAVLDKMQMGLSFEITDYNRAIKLGVAGKIDALPSSIPGEAPGFFYAAEPQVEQNFCLWGHSSEKWRYTGKFDFESVPGKIVVFKNYKYGAEWDKEFAKHSKHLEVHQGENVLSRVWEKVKLKHGVFAFAEERATVEYFKSKTKNTDLVSLGCATGNKVSAFMAFSPADKNNEKLAAEYSVHLKKLRESGKIAEILKKYNLEDTLKKP